MKKIEDINANLSFIYKLENFNGVIKQIKQDREWTRGGIVIASRQERIDNSILANNLFPNFFPEIKVLSNETYLRDFVESKTLEEDPESLAKVIEKMFFLHQDGINLLNNKKDYKVHHLGELWKKGYIFLKKFMELEDMKSIFTYNVGDAKASNLLADSEFVTFDSEGFSIGDISTDITALIESYQYEKKFDLFEETLILVKEKYTKLDKNIIKKSLLGLVGIRLLEVLMENREEDLLDEAIKLFEKFENI
ncbi:MAG: hypothetical protein KAI57_01120 [Candidatus Pacebacteria bacterium]|nr:hypothetical protein [Candidatus Paceibacterota bacterium]